MAEENIREPETVMAGASAGAPESVEASSDEPVREAEAANDEAKSDEDGMASSAERMTILRMIEQGKLSAEDGARLLKALGDRQEDQSKARPISLDTSHYLQVRVSELGTNRQKVNVNLPVALLQLAWRWLPASAKAQFEQVQAAIESGASGRLVEVVDQDSGVRVEITLI